MRKMLSAIAIAVSTITAATTINLHLKDGTLVQKDVTLLDSISFTTEDAMSGTLLKGSVITDASISAGDTILLDSKVEYSLEGLVYVESGAVLNIPAGTVIKGKAGTGENTSALIICSGAKINAKGTAAKPIIMTAETDDVADADDIDNATARGLWGGLVLLGSAPINTLSGSAQVEGIAVTETRTTYGGKNATDNSGELNFVSIRYPGSLLSKDNEINGLTLGGVGSGTKIENVEIFNCSDDGVEFFGGTVATKNILVVGSDDDGFDWDLGYRATNDNWIVVQTGSVGDKLLELDGTSKDSRGSSAYSLVTINNATFVGKVDATTSAVAGGMTFREETGAIIKNSIFANIKTGGLNVSDVDGGSMYTGTTLFAKGDFDMIGNVYDAASTCFKHTNDATNSQPANITNILKKFDAANTFSATTGLTSSDLTPATAYKSKGALVDGDWTADWTYYSAMNK